jgi:hypothetical protein
MKTIIKPTNNVYQNPFWISSYRKTGRTSNDDTVFADGAQSVHVVVVARIGHTVHREHNDKHNHTEDEQSNNISLIVKGDTNEDEGDDIVNEDIDDIIVSFLTSF